ncbi:MAG: helix-turn-helix transcriptional regulator [Clostridiales bacterium]|nr:helix-turn-helix transcriptional regulator [Clostridiales bacterium]
MEFKDRIKELRTEKELTHTQFGSLLEKSEAATRAWETGRTKPDADTLIKLSEYFGCTTDYMLGLSDEFGFKEKDAAPQKKDGLQNNALSQKDSAALDAAACSEPCRKKLKGIEEALSGFSEDHQMYMLDIFERIEDCLIDLKGSSEVQDAFVSSFFSIMMDFYLCINILSQALGDGFKSGGADALDAASIFYTMRNVADMDYRSMWDRLEKYFSSKVPDREVAYMHFQNLMKRNKKRGAQ